MTKFRFALLTTAIALALGACGGSSEPGAEASKPTVSTSPSSVASTTPSPSVGSTARPPGHEHESPEEHAAHEDDPNTISGMYAPDRPPPSGFRRSDAGEGVTGRGAMPFELKIDPGCAVPGQVVDVTLKTGPDLMVALRSSIPEEDDENDSAEVHGRSDITGLFTWRLKVPANMQPGTYDVLAAVADNKGDRGGKSGHWLFVVAEPGKCKS